MGGWIFIASSISAYLFAEIKSEEARTINGGNVVGGIVVHNNGTVIGSSSSGNITGNTAGGIVGLNSSMIINSGSDAVVTGGTTGQIYAIRLGFGLDGGQVINSQSHAMAAALYTDYYPSEAPTSEYLYEQEEYQGHVNTYENYLDYTYSTEYQYNSNKNNADGYDGSSEYVCDSVLESDSENSEYSDLESAPETNEYSGSEYVSGTESSEYSGSSSANEDAEQSSSCSPAATKPEEAEYGESAA